MCRTSRQSGPGHLASESLEGYENRTVSGGSRDPRIELIVSPGVDQELEVRGVETAATLRRQRRQTMLVIIHSAPASSYPFELYLH